MNFQYNATVTNVVDGDTVDVVIDFGFRKLWGPIRLRLWGVDTPEMRGPSKGAGLRAKKWMQDRVLGKDVVLHTIKDRDGTDAQGGFGRYLANVYVEGVNVNDELVRLGYAKPYRRG